jgi:hypothetical protein
LSRCFIGLFLFSFCPKRAEFGSPGTAVMGRTV